MGAVPPEKGLSYAEANHNGKDEPELERPGTSKGKVSHCHISYCRTHEMPHMTASMKRKLMEARTIRIIPRETSCVGIKGGTRRLKVSCEGCELLDDGLSHSSDVATLDVLILFESMIWALYKLYISTARDRDEGPNRVRQCPSMTARIADNHRSATASIKSPIQAPNIAPAVLGAHPRNHRLSPGVKWRYITILPIDIDIP